MGTMSFLPRLCEFLLEHGEIYTVRKYRMPEIDVSVSGVGVCMRHRLGRIADKEQLGQFVALSGFATADEWWKKILYFIPLENAPKYLYHVVRKV